MAAIKGQLVIESVPDENTGKKVNLVLSRVLKGSGSDTLAKLLSSFPVSIRVHISPEQGKLVTAHLEKLGVRVRFVPEPAAPTLQRGEQWISDPLFFDTPSRTAASDGGQPASPTDEKVGAAHSRRRKGLMMVLLFLLCAPLVIVAGLFEYRIIPHLDPQTGAVKTAATQSPAVQKPLPPVDGYFAHAGDRLEIKGIQYAVVDGYTRWTAALYRDRDFEAVERHISSLLDAKSDPAKMYELFILYGTLGGEAESPEKMEEVLNEWCSRNPKSHIPWLVRGNYRIHRAWQIRGSGWAGNVPQDAWAGFEDRLVAASDDLEHAYKLNPNDPNSSAFMLVTARGLSYPESEMEKYFRNAVAACPAHYGAHRHKLEYLKPKWHGTEESMLEFLEQSLKSLEMNPYLALLPGEAYSDLPGVKKGEKALRVDEVWRKVSKAYEDLLERYPQEIRGRYIYAYYAYAARRFDVAFEQFEVIGDRWMYDARWSSLEEYNRCRAFAWYKRGEELILDKKNPAAALDYITASLRYDQTSDAYYALATAYWEMGSSKKEPSLLREAEAALTKAAALKPEDRELGDQLAKYRQWLESQGI